MENIKEIADYLPIIETEKYGTYTRLIDKTDTFGKGFFIFCGLVAFGNLALIGHFCGLALQEEFSPLFLIYIPFFAAAGFFDYKLFKQYRVIKTLHPGEIQVSDWPLILGEEVRLKFKRSVKNGQSFKRVTAKLELIERVTYRQGTNTYTKSNTVWTQELGDKTCNTPTVSLDFDLKIPHGKPPSMELSNNDIIWKLSFQSYYETGDDDSTFNLLVLPKSKR